MKLLRKSNQIFCKYTKPLLKACYLLTLPWQRYIHRRNYKRTEVCVVNLLAAIFGDQRIKGFREKGDETQVSKDVFGHLKPNWYAK